jgi:hypothetical protein
MNLRYEVRYKENGLIRTSQFIGLEKTEEFINQLKQDNTCEYMLHYIVTI